MAQQLAEGSAASPSAAIGRGAHEKGVIWMPDTEIPEIQEITEEEAKKDPKLLADPSQAHEGILDALDPTDFVKRDEEAAEEIILAEDVEEER